MQKMTLAALATLALGLSGCATQMVEASQRECSAFGFPPGTVEYASCVQQRFGQRQRALMQMSAGMQQLGNSMQSTTTPTYLPAAIEPAARTPYSAGGIGFLQRQTVSGMSRLCYYNRLGSPYVMTVGAAELCPLSPP